MDIYLQHEYSNAFGIYYKEAPDKERRWGCFTVFSLPERIQQITKELLLSASQSTEVYQQLRGLIVYLSDNRNGLLYFQYQYITSFSELKFCEYLEPIANQIIQDFSTWFGTSYKPQISAPDLLKDL